METLKCGIRGILTSRFGSIVRGLDSAAVRDGLSILQHWLGFLERSCMVEARGGLGRAEKLRFMDIDGKELVCDSTSPPFAGDGEDWPEELVPGMKVWRD